MITPSLPASPPAAPLRLAGLGIPLVDFITPREQALVDGEALILRARAANPASELQDFLAHGPARIAAARTALAAFTHFWLEARHFDEGDNKKTLTPEDSKRVAHWFQVIITAARAINAAAVVLGEPERQLQIRQMGGTMLNKFAAIKAMLGTDVTVHMLGALGDEDEGKNRQRALDKLAASGIDFHEFAAVTLGNMAASYVIPHQNDRIVLKAPIEELDRKLVARQSDIEAFIRRVTPDLFFIEGSDYSPQKFGAQSFLTFAEAALASGKPIVFSPPTDTDLILGDSPETRAARDAMELLIDSPATVLLTLNESEAVAMFGGEKLDKRAIADPVNHPQLTAALNHLTARLAAKAGAMTHMPLAFVSAGAAGAFHVSPVGPHFVPNSDITQTQNTLGAGDAFAAGVFVAWLRERSGDISDTTLTAITHAGQDAARAVIRKMKNRAA